MLTAVHGPVWCFQVACIHAEAYLPRNGQSRNIDSIHRLLQSDEDKGQKEAQIGELALRVPTCRILAPTLMLLWDLIWMSYV